MTIQTVSPGEPFSFSAQDFNQMARVVNSFSGVPAGNSMTAQQTKQGAMTVWVKLHEDKKFGEAVALKDFALTIDDGQIPSAYVWKTQNAAGDLTCVILRQEGKKDDIVKAVILGLALARASFKNKATHVSPTGEKGALKGDTAGFPVLWQGGDSGDQYALVLLGGGGQSYRQRFFEVIFDPTEKVSEGGSHTRFWVVDGNDSSYLSDKFKEDEYSCGVMIPAGRGESNTIELLKGTLSSNKNDPIYLELEQTYPIDRERPIRVIAKSGPLPLKRTVRKQVLPLARLKFSDGKVTGIIQTWNGETINLFTMFYIGDWMIAGQPDD